MTMHDVGTMPQGHALYTPVFLRILQYIIVLQWIKCKPQNVHWDFLVAFVVLSQQDIPFHTSSVSFL